MRIRPALVTLLLLILPGATSLLLAAKPYRLAAVDRDAKGKPRPADLIRQMALGATFEIGYLDEAARRGAISSALGRDLDLLPGRVDEQRRGYLVFVLKVTNDSGADLLFNPGHARLASDKEDLSFALDYTGLYKVIQRIGAQAPSLEELGTILFDREVTIQPGGSVRKLLAFEGPRDEWFHELNVRLLEINIGLESVDMIFPFRKFPVDQAASGEK
jgi:hypothetical protein